MKVTRYYKGIHTDGESTAIVTNGKALWTVKRKRANLLELLGCGLEESLSNSGSVCIDYDVVSFWKQNEDEDENT